ncbi:GWT1-domain-containing protein [Thelephora terrestris]|uniref:GPI-anchored wall transfer protein n=1 Tax=Thelephora terrestris TaxID=56493 RepID=A0A9P6H7Q2_9AGAM|nr:GWT1-domain-containing protein [Thelephora terrestris]
MSDYKASKEAFVSGATGSSITHINMISAVALSSIALYSALRSRLPPSKSLVFPAEWLLLVAPLLLSMTLFANSPGMLSLVLIFPTALLLIVPRRESGTPLPSNLRTPSPNRAQYAPTSPHDQQSPIVQLPALTTYRAHMMLMTVLSILAVDFPVFPRSLAKCETYGVSLMDLGVGSFVFSQGIVSAAPITKSPDHLSSPLRPKIAKALRRSLPIWILGFLRLIAVKLSGYPEHESEYGTHWNFFFTMGTIPVIEVLLHPIIPFAPVSMIAIAIALFHQVALSVAGWREFVLFAPRSNLLRANKEGIVSLFGYLAIHLLGLSTGTMILPPSPSYFRRQQLERLDARSRRDSNARLTAPSSMGSQREDDKTATELAAYAILWWSFLGLSSFFASVAGVSRRLVNLPYILWVAAFNTSFILAYILLDLFFFPSPLSKSIYSPTSKLKVPKDRRKASTESQTQPVKDAPVLLHAINQNGLSVFLLANVSTGLVNLVFPTMYTNDVSAMVILSIYSIGVCLFAWITRDRRLWKF